MVLHAVISTLPTSPDVNINCCLCNKQCKHVKNNSNKAQNNLVTCKATARRLHSRQRILISYTRKCFETETARVWAPVKNKIIIAISHSCVRHVSLHTMFVLIIIIRLSN